MKTKVVTERWLYWYNLWLKTKELTAPILMSLGVVFTIGFTLGYGLGKGFMLAVGAQ